VPPIQDACLSCHDSEAAAAHAETNTTMSGAEACTVCHGEGSSKAVSAVHALDP
jgi:predicted CXXCH cytochrome family protein